MKVSWEAAGVRYERKPRDVIDSPDESNAWYPSLSVRALDTFMLYCGTHAPDSAAFLNHALHIASLGFFGAATPYTAKAQGSSAYDIATHRR
jgi:hypothetical protein